MLFGIESSGFHYKSYQIEFKKIWTGEKLHPPQKLCKSFSPLGNMPALYAIMGQLFLLATATTTLEFFTFVVAVWFVIVYFVLAGH